MTDLRRVPLPRGDGPVQWHELELVLREILARTDARNPNSDFASGLVANQDGSVTLSEAFPTGRTATLAELTTRLTDAGKAEDQRFLPIVNAGNRLSAQNVNPLTSIGSISTSQIAIASHTVQYGFGTVSYGSGSITGLTPLTTYFVYAADPDYAGGAVAYSATLAPTTVVSNDGYYYVGSITTANSTPSGNVSAATSANPIEIETSSAHGFTNGNTVTFAGMPGSFAALNGNNYTITYVSTTKFTVAVNGTGFPAYTSGGTVTRVSTGTSGGGSGGGWNWSGEIP